MKPQNFSVNDGNGIRTIIFFGACPLRCKWCSNPESHINLNDSSECQYNEYIHKYSTNELLEIIEKQIIFYRYSGGGVTFSGGEPTLQQDILRELTNKLYDKGLNLAIESSGYFDFYKIKDILEKMNLIFIDIKHMDDEKHKSVTGVSNGKILDNIIQIDKLNIPIVVRIPVIVGLNSNIDNIKRTAGFLKQNIRDPKIELLPYHKLGDEKYEVLNRNKPSRNYKAPSGKELEQLKKLIEEEGVEIVSYK